MFTRRHEQELSEIKALTTELSERMQEVQEQLDGIVKAQASLGTPGRADGDDAAGETRAAKRARRKANRLRAKGQGAEPAPAGAGAKKSRGRERDLTTVGEGAKLGKRQRLTAMAAPDEAPEGGQASKRRGEGRRKRRQADTTPSPGSDAQEQPEEEQQSG
jgi:hypothetical protein